MARKGETNQKQGAEAAPNDREGAPVVSLSPQREAEIAARCKAYEGKLIDFPGKAARRIAWSAKIQRAAARDASDLTRTPFEGEPPITSAEIHTQAELLEYLRRAQTKWRAAYVRKEAAAVEFEKLAVEASAHKETLLRFFDLRFRKNIEGQKRLAEVRAGSGDADIVQDVSDLLHLCAEHKAALASAPRGEAAAAARLAELAPKMSHLLAEKGLSVSARESRRQRDVAYTLVMLTEQRYRAAASYWYDGADQAKDYAAFPSSSPGGAGEPDEPEDEGGTVDEPGATVA